MAMAENSIWRRRLNLLLTDIGRGMFLVTHSGLAMLGLAAAALVIIEIYGGAYWHPSLFIRVFGWTATETAFYYGAVSGCIGIISAYTSGSVTNYFKKRGMAEGVWMTAMIGCIGCTVLGGLGPIMPTQELALVLLLLTHV